MTQSSDQAATPPSDAALVNLTLGVGAGIGHIAPRERRLIFSSPTRH